MVNKIEDCLSQNKQLREENKKYREAIDKALCIIENRLEENHGHVNARMEMIHYEHLKDI